MSDDPFLAQLLAARITRGTDEPINRIIVEEIWLAVVEGTLGTGERLPTSRQVAIRLGVSPRTVERAYEELEARGVVATRAGEGTFISLHPPPEAERERHRQFAQLCRECFDRAVNLGFSLDDLIGCLAEFRSLERPGSAEERLR